MRVFLLLIFSTVVLITRIGSVMNGYSTSIHRAPFVAYVWGIQISHKYASRTTGILVHRRYVLMSARRCRDHTDFRVTMGSSTSSGPGGTGQGCLWKEWWIHPLYKKYGEFSYSFCLLKLDKNMKLSRTVQVATLATPAEHVHNNNYYVVAGWGITKPSYAPVDGAWPNELHYIESQLADYDSCRKIYRGLLDPEDLYCIGFATDDKRQKTGRGDEGAPFFSQQNGVVYAMVVNVMEEEPLEKENWPTLAANVSLAYEWIYKVIRENHIASDEDMVNLCYGKDQG